MQIILFGLLMFAASTSLFADEGCKEEFLQLESMAAGYADSGFGDIASDLIAARALNSEGLCEDATAILREALTTAFLGDTLETTSLENVKEQSEPGKLFTFDVASGFSWFKYDESDSAEYYFKDSLVSDSSSYLSDPSHEYYLSASVEIEPGIEWIKRAEAGLRIGNISYQQYTRFGASFVEDRLGFDLYEKGTLYINKASGDSSDIVNGSLDMYLKYPFSVFGTEFTPKAAAALEVERYRYNRNGYVSSNRLILKPALSATHGDFWGNYSLERDSKSHGEEFDSLDTVIWRQLFSADYYHKKFSTGFYGSIESNSYASGELYFTLTASAKFTIDLRLNYEKEYTHMSDHYILSGNVLYLPAYDTLFLDSVPKKYEYTLNGKKIMLSATGKWEFVNNCFAGILFSLGNNNFPVVTTIGKYSLHDTINSLEDPYTLYRLGTLLEVSKEIFTADFNCYAESKKPDKQNPNEAKSKAIRTVLSIGWEFYKGMSFSLSGDFEKRWYDTLKPKDEYSEKIAAHTLTNAFVSAEIRGRF
ncbi:MAG: hypothetical protein JNL74_16640 [Fibrobacteres bacterium]|nr:hypothetical protein [Fibrobacterota bacterium]